MKPYARADRVGSLIQQIVSDILQKDIRDPRLDLTTITGVKVTPDLKLARIYYSVSNNKSQEAYDGFMSAHGFIKRKLAGELGLRYMPELTFHYDESFDRGERIDQLLKSISDDEPLK